MNKYLTFLASIILTVCTYAQVYKAAVIYEAHGPIKEIRTKSENPFAKGKLKFMPNGQKKTEVMTFDDNGYPIGSGMNMGDMFTKLNITYDSLLNVSSMTFETNIIGNKQKIEVTNYYDCTRLVSRKINLSSPKKSGTIQFEFSDEKYDDYGNWIERTVHEKGIDQNNKIGKEKTYVETRIITYYK